MGVLVRSMSRVGNVITIDFSGAGPQSININDLNGSPNSKAAQIRDFFQQFLQVVIALSDLPSDDPDKTINPNRPDIYWSNADGTVNTSGLFLTSRSATVSVTAQSASNYTWSITSTT